METADTLKNKSETVKVVVRCRPMSKKEKAAGYHSVVKVYPAVGAIEIFNRNSSPTYFKFDAVYDCGHQTEIYDEVFCPLVDSVINGFNGTVFAYGQTGAGKTYTMEGNIGDPEHEGVIPNSSKHIFNHIACSENTQFLVSASYFEIYQGNVRDLLSSDPKKKLDVRERKDTGVYVKDLTVSVCKTIQELEKVMIDGKRNRSIGTTNMNAHSSRSHAIFIISIESCKTDAEGNQHVKIGKLNLVDLAGSQKQSKTGAVGFTQKESIKINLSLSALGNVISALVDGKGTRVPYRNSKLTQFLQDSLGGKAKTIMIANIGPASFNFDETMTTLSYAKKAKNIKNKPVVNVDPVSLLKAQLALKEAKMKKNGASKTIEDDVIHEMEPASVEIVKGENLPMEKHVAFLNVQNLMTEEKEKNLKDIKAKDEKLRLENEAKGKIKSQLQVTALLNERNFLLSENEKLNRLLLIERFKNSKNLDAQHFKQLQERKLMQEQLFKTENDRCHVKAKVENEKKEIADLQKKDSSDPGHSNTISCMDKRELSTTEAEIELDFIPECIFESDGIELISTAKQKARLSTENWTSRKEVYSMEIPTMEKTLKIQEATDQINDEGYKNEATDGVKFIQLQAKCRMNVLIQDAKKNQNRIVTENKLEIAKLEETLKFQKILCDLNKKFIKEKLEQEDTKEHLRNEILKYKVSEEEIYEVQKDKDSKSDATSEGPF